MNLLMFFSKRIVFSNPKVIPLGWATKIKFSATPPQFYLSFRPLSKVPLIKYHFSFQNNTVLPTEQSQKQALVKNIISQIEDISKNMQDQKELKEMERIIYPQALLHGQQNISKISKLYDIMMQHLEKENLQHKHFQQLIKAGDFYYKMEVRRLKALRPYLKAKHHIQVQNLHQNPQIKKTYEQLCCKIDKLIEEDINYGECTQVQKYYKEGLQQEKEGNQLQSLYFYYKGICVSDYKQIPNKLLHFNLLAHYIFLSQLMKPKCPYMNEADHYNQSINKYNELESLGQTWFNEEFLNAQYPDKKHQFKQAQIWVHANKGNIFFRAKNYPQAIKCYEKVVDFYKSSQDQGERLQILKIVDHLQKSYERLGMESKAIDFLEWAHDFIKRQISENAILMSKYLKTGFFLVFFQTNYVQPILKFYKSLVNIIQKNLSQLKNNYKQLIEENSRNQPD